MTVSSTHPAAGRAPAAADDSIFTTVLVGIDEGPESLDAAAQARALCAYGGRLVLLGVAETYLAAQAGPIAPLAEEHLLAGAEAALERARSLVEADEVRVATGRFLPELRAACAATGTTLVAVGAPRHGRLSAFLFGRREVEIVHDPPCAVLAARPGWGVSGPERVVFAVGGPPVGFRAERAARALGARLGRPAVPVAGPADAVAGEATERDLVVVGARTPHRHHWRGSVAERVAGSAPCSVLVVPVGGEDAA